MKTSKQVSIIMALLFIMPFVAGQSVDIGDGVMATYFHPDCEYSEVYVDGVGCTKLQVEASTRVYDDTSPSAAASSVGDIDPIKVTNPWAAAGQPVVIEFTLENIGDEFSYPFNQIPLLPDSFVLTLAMDKDIGVRTPEGRYIDVWEQMNSGEKFAFLMKISFSSAVEEIKQELEGRTCGFVDVRKHLPDRIQDYVDERSGVNNLPIKMWECVKIVDLPFFASELKGLCRDGITTACLAEADRQFGNMVTSTTTVLLSSTEESGLPRGECSRPYLQAGFFGKAALETLNKRNIVLCSIGDDGLQPGEEVTFRFVGIVPADAPVVPPKEVEKVQDLKQGYTQSVTCQDSRFANACHSIYAGVYPSRNDNFVNWIVGRLEQPFAVIGCSFKSIFQEGSFNQCFSTRGQGNEGVGNPIWEGAGTFYVLGPALRASINLLLFAIYAGTLLTSFSIGRKR